MDNNVIDIRINDYGTLEVVTIPVKLYKDSYKVVKLRVKAPKNDTAILKVYGSDRDDAGEQVWTTSAYTLPYKENVVIGNKEYTVYEDYIPEEFCQKNGELYLTFSQGLMDLENWVSIITSGTLNLYVSGEGFNYAGVEIPESDKLAYKINKTFENYEKIVVDVDNTKQDAENAKTNSEEALSKAEEALSQVTESTGTNVYVNGAKVNTFNADTKADVGVTNRLQQDINSISSSIGVIKTEQSELSNKQSQLEQNQNLINNKQSQLSNSNLLINGDFRVNQRDLPSYNTDKYTVDRWRSSSSYLQVNVVDTGINLKNGSRNRFILQPIENIKGIVGQTVTLSIKTKGTVGITSRISFYNGTDTSDKDILQTGEYQVITFTYTIPSNWSSVIVLFYPNRATSPLETDEVFVDFIKMEIGSVATAFSPRPYAEELAMCQRYNVDLIRNTSGYPYVAMGFARNETQLFVVLNLPQAMRVRPTTFVYGGLYLNGSNKVNELITSSNISFGGMAANGNQISLTITTTGLIAGQCYALQLRDNGHIGIDAEIY